jgi:hypothetical protein
MSFSNESFIEELVCLIRNDVKQSSLYQIINDFKPIIEFDSIDSLNNFIMDNNYFVIPNATVENFEQVKQMVIQEQINEFCFNILDLGGLGFYKDLDKTYYSAYPNNINISDFVSKNILWFSLRKDQALLHPLDNKDFSSPVFFSFKLNKPILTFSSGDRDNINLFNKEPAIREKTLSLINKYRPDKLTNESVFSGNHNKYILYIAEAYNRIINSPFIKISGYVNDFDQCELAIINFSTCVSLPSVKKFIYTKISADNEIQTFPLEFKKSFLTLFPQLEGNITGFYKSFAKINDIDSKQKFDSSKHMMSCSNYQLKIYYQIDDKTEPEQVFDCSDKDSSWFWDDCIQDEIKKVNSSSYKKYLKYKQKYLNLKAHLRNF